jgi:ribulose-phosphate 3-epimerase
MGRTWSDWHGEPVVEPSLYASDLARLGEQVTMLLVAGCRVFHFDVGDGHFIPEVTMGPIVLAAISDLIHDREGFVDCHLMVAEPERHFASLRKAGGDSVTFHVEARPDTGPVIERARDLGLGVGVAFSPGTPVAVGAACSEGADLSLCMSIEPGYSGQAFLPESVDRIADLRRRLPEGTLVQVDGGINLDTIVRARAAGADLHVAGSSIFWQEDPAAGYRALLAAVGG